MERARAGSSWLLVIGLIACAEAAPDGQDLVAPRNEAPDVPRLADATVLVPLDASWSSDPSGPDGGGTLPGTDVGPEAHDLGSAPRETIGPSGSDATDEGSDPDFPIDGRVEDESERREFPDGVPCGSETCDSTQVCVWDGEGNAHCAPKAECSGRGAMSLEELIRWFRESEGSEIPFKVLGQPWVGKPTCGGPSCAGECCRLCWALLFLGSPQIPLPLMGQGVAISCQGTECDWMDRCAPMTPGRWYWIWGRAARLGGDFRLLVEGFCPADRPSPID